MDLPESQEQFEQEPTDELAEKQPASVEAKHTVSSSDQKPAARSETQIIQGTKTRCVTISSSVLRPWA
jgi:hypothetical protein